MGIDATFELVGLLGESMKRFDLIDGEKLLSLDAIPTGIYFYRIIEKGSTLKSGKINIID